MDTFSQYGDAFAAVIRNGVDRLMPATLSLAYAMSVFGVFALAKGGLFGDRRIMANAIHLVLVAGFYILVIKNIQSFGNGIMESAVAFGLMAGGSSMSPDAFLKSPDAIFAIGYTKAADLFELADAACIDSYIGCLGNISSWLPVQAAAWFVYGTFALAALMVIGTCMLFKLSLLAGMVLLPLAIFSPTMHLGFMPIRSVIHFSVQLMVLAMVISVNSLVFTKLTLGIVPGVDSVTPIILGTAIFLGTVLGASVLAAALTSGGMLAGGALLAIPLGMAISAGRSGVGHLDKPATAAAKGAGMVGYGAAEFGIKSVSSRIGAMRRAANRGNE